MHRTPQELIINNGSSKVSASNISHWFAECDQPQILKHTEVGRNTFLAFNVCLEITIFFPTNFQVLSSF